MLFHTHLLLGIVAFLLVKDHFPSAGIMFLILVLLGSVLPDIDDGKSKIKRASGVFGSMISFLFKHRGIFHSLLFVIFLFIVLGLWRVDYAWALSMGYISHLFGDALTPMGIALFYPLSNWRIRGPIKVGSIGEWVILFGAVVLIVLEFF